MTDERRMHYAATEEGLRDALAVLGSTPDAVAATLANGGYRGQRGVGCACPVAAYLKDVIAGRDFVVGTDETSLCDGKTPDGDLVWSRWVKTPRAVAEFVTAFDYGMWPELAVES